MATLLVENIPESVFDNLRKQAAVERQTIPERVLQMLGQMALTDVQPSPRLPDLVFDEEISAPCDLPRSSKPEMVSFYEGQPRWPDPPSSE